MQLSDEQAIEWQLIELSIVGKSFICLYATRTLFICNRRTGLTLLLDTTECRRPMQCNAVAYIAASVVISGSATIHSELVMLMVFPFTSTCFLSEPQMDLIGEDIQFHLRMRSH